MARGNRSVLEDLFGLPWWINVILAVVAYFSFIYWIPSVSFNNVLVDGLAQKAPSAALYPTALFLFCAALSALVAWQKGQLLDSQKNITTLRTITWQEFEILVGEAYRRKGYSVSETGGGGADGGVDLVIKKGGEKLLIQCKHWKFQKAGVKIVRELYGVIAAEGASGGIVITSGTFTQEAKDFARGKPLELVDGNKLMKLVADVQKSPTPGAYKAPDNTVPQPNASNKTDNFCPLCGSEMVLRTARRGKNAGDKFWGCSAYPRCRATKTSGESRPSEG